jgi:hypothetical protein
MAKKQEMQWDKTTIGAAVNTAFSGIEEIGSEMRDWFDNMPENLQGSGKGDEVSEAADTLEGVSEPDVPSCIAEREFDRCYFPPKKRMSRSARLDEYLDYARQAVTEMQAALDEPHYSEEEKAEIESCVSETQDMIDEAEGVSFPGMY